MNATFWTFSKRNNSTAVPAGVGTVLDVNLKEGCSLLNPVFLLNVPGTFTWSYMEYNGRYYKITDIVSLRQDLWQVSASVDVLATYKSNIQAASAFVAYDTTANMEITDRRLSVITTASRQESVSTDSYEILTHTASSMAVILNVVGDDSCCTYATTVANARTLLDTISTWTTDIFDTIGSIDSITEFGEVCVEFFKKMMSSGPAADCIRSAYLLPVNYSLIGGTPTGTDGIVLGEFPTERAGKIITQRWLHDGIGVTIPWQASDWRRNAPYHEIYLYIPFIGVVSYPASALIGATSIYVDFAIDVTNGETIITVSLDSVGGQVIGQYNCNLASGYAIGASNVTPLQTATGLLMGAGGAVAMMATGGAAGVIAGTGGIVGEMNSISPLPTSIGSAGGGAVLGLRGGAADGFALRCMTIFHNTNVTPDSVSAVIGTPSNAVKSLSGLSGYVETRNASVSGAMTETERLQINSLLDGGIYIE